MAGDDDLPISWDEAREIVVVVTTAAAVLMMLSPVVGFFEGRFPGAFGDDVAELTRNAAPPAGILVLVAAMLVATTPRSDVVPALRTAVGVVAFVIAAAGVAAMTVELTRPSASGMFARLQSVFGRSGPGTMLAATARWLVLQVEPFADRRSTDQ